MKEQKRRMERFSPYDHTGMEQHLEKMAAEGWLLESIRPHAWVYRRIEPQKLHFAVTYYPKASEFDPEPSEEQKIYQDYSAHTGWEFLCSSAQMQIFCNREKEPIPLDTEPALEVDAIHKAMKRGYLPSMLLLFVVAVLNGGLFISGLLGDPLEILSSPVRLSTGISWAVLLLLTIFELIGYYRWHHRAVIAAENGEFLDTPNHVKVQTAALVIVGLALAYWLISIFAAGDRIMQTISILMLAYFIGLFSIVNAVKQLLKRKKASRTVNFTVTMIVDFALAILFMVGITFGTIKAAQDGWLSSEANGLYQNGLPLTVEDLQDVDFDEYIRAHRTSESIFISRMTAQQFARADADRYVNAPWMDYDLTIVKMPFLYNFCKNAVLNSRTDDVRNGEVVFTDHYVEIDAAPWLADEAYQLYWSESYVSRYVLCYGNRIIELNTDWDLTGEQMRIVAEKLAPVA